MENQFERGKVIDAFTQVYHQINGIMDLVSIIVIDQGKVLTFFYLIIIMYRNRIQQSVMRLFDIKAFTLLES